MNICMVGLGIGKTHGAFVGGHVNNVINLSKVLAENGFQVHIVTTPPIHSDRGKSEASYELQNGVTIHIVNVFYDNASNKISEKGRLGLSCGFKSYFQIVSTIKKLHKNENFDVIHGHSGFPWVALIPEYLGIRERVPSAHTIGCPIKDGFGHRMISKLCLSKLDLTIALSDNVRNSLKNIIPEHRIKVIPPLIDLSRFNYNFKEKSDSPHLLYVGNLSKTKGLHILLRALKIVKKDFPNIKLSLGLDMPLDEFESRNLEIKKELKALDLIENVIPLGIIKNLPEVMARSDMLVAPFTSTYGPMDYPLSILEAMASGLPVVATNVGGVPEIVSHGERGMLVEPNDPVGLADSIQHLLRNMEEAIGMGRNGHNFVLDLNQGAVNKLGSVYLELVENLVVASNVSNGGS